MARLIRDDEVEIVDGYPVFTYHWEGIGIAYVSGAWLFCDGGLVADPGDISLRIIGREAFPGGTFVVQDNYRWPLWWLLLRILLFLRWFESNLRLTAAVWGLLKNEMGCMPRWSDFVVWRRIKRRQTNETT